MEEQSANQIGRDALNHWQNEIKKNIFTTDTDLIHTIHHCLQDKFAEIQPELAAFGQQIPTLLEPLVNENNLSANLPHIDPYDGIGNPIEQIVHHPNYVLIGDIIYGSKLLSYLKKPGGLSQCLSLFFLSSQAGEAGHNCPIACSAGVIRIFNKVADFPNKSIYLEKLFLPSYQTNFTGAQFLTEVQGGSDVGQNATHAKFENNTWRIYGEKWFCSNANAEIMFVTARFDPTISGTKGLGLFFVPAIWNEKRNRYTFRRLKDKLGTRSLATAEIDFAGAYAYLMGDLQNGFNLVMENVLHISRLFNSFTVIAMARRAYHIAKYYAQARVAFSKPIIEYPAISDNLAKIRVENTAMLSTIFTVAQLQDQYDCQTSPDKTTELLLRILVNISKSFTAKLSVIHIHHCLDILAGNGTIESFSTIPRLLRDCIVCENWEGTHNVLHMQILKDIHKYNIDQIFISYIRKEINRLDKKSPYPEMIANQLHLLEKKIAEFRREDADIQALQIHLIVNQMAFIFCALCLCFEAQAQLKTGTSNKLDYLQFFLLLNTNQNEIVYNRDYLDLIKRINQY